MVLIMKYNDGRINAPQVAQPIGYPGWWLESFGVDSEIGIKWAQPATQPPLFFEKFGTGPFEAVADETSLADAPVVPESKLSTFAQGNSWFVLLPALVCSYMMTFWLGTR